MKAMPRKLIWPAGAAIVVASLLYLVFRPEQIDVETATVSRGPLEVVIEEDGETRVRERYVVSAQVAGRMARPALTEGDAVDAGDVIARIFPLPLDERARAEGSQRLQAAEAVARAAVANVGQAEAHWGEARRSLDRVLRVEAGAPGSTSRQEIDEMQTAERSAALALEQARDAADAALHDVGIARAVLLGSNDGRGVTPSLVRAPVSGRVLRVYEEFERAVTPGTPIIEIGDPHDLEIVVDVLTEDAARLRTGSAARVTAGAGADTLSARVERVEPSAFTRVSPLGVEEQRVNVVLALDRPAPLGDRFRVDAQLVTWRGTDVVRVPVSALFRSRGSWAVFVADGDRARRRPVTIGHMGRIEAEVLSGLDQGARVIVFPSEDLRDGSRIGD